MLRIVLLAVAAAVFVLLAVQLGGWGDAPPPAEPPSVPSAPAVAAPSADDALRAESAPPADGASSSAATATPGPAAAAAVPVDEPVAVAPASVPVGSVQGRIYIGMDPPLHDPIDRSADPYFADAPPFTDETLLVGPDNSLRNAVVSLVGPVDGGAPPLPAAVEMRIVDGRFVPRIAIVPAGGTLRIVNDDDTTYELNGVSDQEEGQSSNPTLRGTLAGRGAALTHGFPRAEPGYVLTCARHDWLVGRVAVVDHPYHVLTDESGHYTLRDVPAGEYAVRVWHESLGHREEFVVVREGEEAELSVVFGRRGR